MSSPTQQLFGRGFQRVEDPGVPGPHGWGTNYYPTTLLPHLPTCLPTIFTNQQTNLPTYRPTFLPTYLPPTYLPTRPDPTRPDPTLPYLTLPYLTLPYLTLPYLTLPYLTLPYLTLPYLTLPYLATSTTGTTVDAPRGRRNQTVERVHVGSFAVVQVTPCAQKQMCRYPSAWRRDGMLEGWRSVVRGEGKEDMFWSPRVTGGWGVGGWGWVGLDVRVERDCATSKLQWMFLNCDLANTNSGFRRQDHASLVMWPSHVIPWCLIDGVSFTIPGCCVSSSASLPLAAVPTILGIAFTPISCGLRTSQNTMHSNMGSTGGTTVQNKMMHAVVARRC